MSSCLGRSHAKAAKASLDGSCRCVLQRGALRRAPLERGASSCLDALPQFEASGALPMCRANDPRSHECVTDADVDQASAAVLAALLFPCATLGILPGDFCGLTGAMVSPASVPMEAGEGAERSAGAAAAAEGASVNPEEAGKRDDGNGNCTDDDRRRAHPGRLAVLWMAIGVRIFLSEIGTSMPSCVRR
jgi:hypothetical protein